MQSPPTTLRETLAHLGPGIILASSIVGSGELIAATTVGAEAGFILLWLIVIGCGIKVAAQIEIGRHTLTWGRTPLAAFDRVPGPRLGGLGWIYWGWAIMTALVIVQQGGILAGVAQTLAAGAPVTAAGREWNRVHDAAAATRIEAAAARRNGAAAEADVLDRRLAGLEAEARGLPAPGDETVWAVIVGVVTSILLSIGRYRVIERVSIVLVGTFTLVTLLALLLLQFEPAWAISARELASGLVPSIPPALGGRSPLMTALATFGIIGVGASELMFYPYWCLEKGYGRAVGPRDESSAWAERARGWLRVMQVDAWASMVVYTVVTVAFYLLGAATLGRLGLRPGGGEMVRALGAMYAPVFGAWAEEVFLVGAFAVLYSTLFAAADGNARIVADGLALAGWIPGTDDARRVWSRRIATAWPLVALVLALLIREPVGMVLASGAMQAVMLTALGVAVIWFRYRATDPRLTPSKPWDLLLWLSAAGFIMVGLWTVWQKLQGIMAAQ
ncbi:MAG: transmembrane Mn(2+) transporter [Planctomycetia bacterium]|nr:transmembrane Mn(2+) transporter [Planctomycetia bacterium]